MKKRLLIALAVCAALILSACGGTATNPPEKSGTELASVEAGGTDAATADDSGTDAPALPDGADADFTPIAGVWIADEGEGVLTIYDNGGFRLDGPETLEGYLVYTEEDGEGLWDSGPRYEMYEENNERVPNSFLAFDEQNPGKLNYGVGGGTYSRAEASDGGFAQIAGTWISEEGIGILTVYGNGGFLLDGDETLEGYLVYTEEDGEGLWDSGPRYELYLENNERVPNCCFALDDAQPGKLVYAEGGGAILYSRPDAVYDDSGIVLRVLRPDESFFAAFADVETFIHDDGEYSTEIAVCPTRRLQNFKFLSIAWQEANDDDVFFSIEELYSLDALTPERPLLLQTSFPGDMPSIGISYTDADGAPQYFAIGESGYDGSLYLSEFTPNETP